MSRAEVEYYRAIKAEGFVIQSRVQNKHVKLRATHPATGDKLHTIIVPTSVYEGTSLKKFKGDIRRLIRERAAA